MAKRLTWFIVVGMIAGIIAGYAANIYTAGDAALAAEFAKYFKLGAEIFLNLIKMIVAPLVLSTIVVGIAHMGDGAALGRIGGRALLWFITASLVSISLGLLLVNLFQPGVGAPIDTSTTVGELQTSALNLHDFILHIFPSNIFEAMATNNILQILVFSIFAGIALAAIGERGAPLVRGAEALADLMLRITNYVMLLAPLAVFGALAAVITKSGVGILGTFITLIGEFYLGLLILWCLLLTAGWVVLRGRIWSLIRYIREPVLIAFSTASSEAALPRLFEQLDRFGVPRRISGFMLPLGYSFNLDGSMMYMSFATLFIAQAYGIHLPVATQIAMLLTLMVTSKGIAAVPRASLVVISATLAQFGLPVEGVALVLGVDIFLDMGRTATNVVGNAVATGVITKWEGMLQPEMPDADTDPLPPFDTPEDGRKGLHLEGGA
jgi:Na+/H+-dicarboxylate symporter